MRDYQLVGLRWLAMMHANGCNAILADEMGLGKTLQTIAFLAHLKFAKGEGGPHLVVCPLSVLSSWMSELKVGAPALGPPRPLSGHTRSSHPLCSHPLFTPPHRRSASARACAR